MKDVDSRLFTRMLGKDGRTDGRTDGLTDSSVTISLRNFVGEGIIRRHITPLRERKYKIINVQGEVTHDKIGEVIRSYNLLKGR